MGPTKYRVEVSQKAAQMLVSHAAFLAQVSLNTEFTIASGNGGVGSPDTGNTNMPLMFCSMMMLFSLMGFVVIMNKRVSELTEE